MPLNPYRKQIPRMGARVYVHPSAEAIGDVELGDDVSLWCNVVLRGDIGKIRIGSGSNLQDGAIGHVSRASATHPQGAPLIVGAGLGRACRDPAWLHDRRRVPHRDGSDCPRRCRYRAAMHCRGWEPRTGRQSARQRLALRRPPGEADTPTDACRIGCTPASGRRLHRAQE
jgi:hypothetical protein